VSFAASTISTFLSAFVASPLRGPSAVYRRPYERRLIGHRPLSLQGDVTKKEDLKRIVDEIKKEHEGIHILVNNVSQTSPLCVDYSR
jgi:NAD(P)-dependent dehydrogenase (short-subunit alcohol dehydrogenase family)